MGWESIISSTSPESHPQLLHPAWMQDGLFPLSGSRVWVFLLGSPGAGMLIGAACGEDESVFCGVTNAELK